MVFLRELTYVFHIKMSAKKVMKSIEISPGVQMPMFGLGTWQIRDKGVIFKILDAALECGYRFIDTAAIYGNEIFIGEALEILLPKYGLERRDIFITSKLSTANHGLGNAYEAGLRSLANLRTNYLDLFLIHFPGVSGMDSKDPRVVEMRKGSWIELEKLKREGKFRAIGVSNYSISHLENLRQYASIWPPAVNQCEFHPHHKPNDHLQYCRDNGIHFQAYTSLGGAQNKEKLFNEPLIKDLSKKYNCAIPQLLLAWALNQGISVLPKTTNPDHVRLNLKAIDIVINEEDIKLMSNLSTVTKYCWDSSVVI